MTAYSAALSFRTSHYFVSYLSEVTATAVGIGYENRADGPQDWYVHADMLFSLCLAMLFNLNANLTVVNVDFSVLNSQSLICLDTMPCRHIRICRIKVISTIMCIKA